jgi:hypothetical protein
MKKRKSNPILVGASFGASPGLLIGLVWTMMASGSGESGLAAMGVVCFLSIVITVIGAIVGAVAGYFMSRSIKYHNKGPNNIDNIFPPDMR